MTFEIYIMPLIVGIVSGTIGTLLTSYFKEKGKNLATKEDIGKITLLVEDVKHSFTKETEKLKANLQLITNLQMGILSEERNAIIELNVKYFRWLNLLLDTSLQNIDIKDNTLLDKHFIIIGAYFNEMLDSETKFELFVDNLDLIKKAKDLKLLTLKLINRPVTGYILEMQKHNLDVKEMHNMPPHTQGNRNLDLTVEFGNIHKKFRNTLMTNYKELFVVTQEFQKLSREHLYKLING